jgi:IS605 OrfB family transposase
MITIKLQYKSSIEYYDFLSKLRKQFSNVYRYSYNRFYDGLSKKEIYALIPSLNNTELIKGRLINDCIDFASRLYEKDKKSNHKSIFGGKYNFYQKCKEKITKEQFLQNRLIPLYLQGETARNGNRNFNLDFLNNSMTFKYNKDCHFDLKVKPSKNQLKHLIELQNLCQDKKSKFTITLSQTHINISFDVIKHEVIDLIKNRFIGIDLNPTNIGISVLNSEMELIDSYDFEFSKIINKIKSIKKSSDSKELKYLNNKLNHEILDISKKISNISIHYKCKFIFIEDLDFKQTDKGRQFNRLVKNLWKRNIFINNLNKRCEINGQKLYQVNPAYSSFIGNCMYDKIDPVNSSMEVGRRGYEIIINKSKKFYPEIKLKESLKHQWKEMVSDIQSGWKELFNLIKNSKLSYRVSLNEVNDFNVFSKKVRMYDIYQF